MAEIPLSRDRATIVDDEDYPSLNAYRWQCNGRYATRQVRLADGRYTTVYMHRVIMNAPPGLEVDHINHDTLDNRRSNLRLVTRSQNEQNAPGPRRDSRTGVRGVSRNSQTGIESYRARLWINGKRIFLGTYHTLEEADAAVRAGRKRYMTHAPENREVS